MTTTCLRSICCKYGVEASGEQQEVVNTLIIPTDKCQIFCSHRLHTTCISITETKRCYSVTGNTVKTF